MFNSKLIFVIVCLIVASAAVERIIDTKSESDEAIGLLEQGITAKYPRGRPFSIIRMGQKSVTDYEHGKIYKFTTILLKNEKPYDGNLTLTVPTDRPIAASDLHETLTLKKEMEHLFPSC